MVLHACKTSLSGLSKKRKAVWALCVCVLGIMGSDAPSGTPVWTPYLSSVVIGSLFSLISCFS